MRADNTSFAGVGISMRAWMVTAVTGAAVTAWVAMLFGAPVTLVGADVLVSDPAADPSADPSADPTADPSADPSPDLSVPPTPTASTGDAGPICNVISSNGAMVAPTAYALGAGVQAPVQLYDNGEGDTSGMTFTLEIDIQPLDQPAANPAAPSLAWRTDGGVWHPVSLTYEQSTVDGSAMWISNPMPAPTIGPSSSKLFRIWMAFNDPTAPGYYNVVLRFSTAECSSMGDSYPITFTYYPQGLHTGSQTTASNRRRSSSSSTPTPSQSDPSSIVAFRTTTASADPPAAAPRRAGSGIPESLYKGAGTAFAALLAAACAVQWRRARRHL